MKIRTVILAALLGTAAVNSTAQYIIDSGYCGVYGGYPAWTLYSDSTLIISGSGSMTDYYKAWENYPPWNQIGNAYGLLIKTIIIGDSVTYIGNEAFEYCINLTSVSIGNNVTTTGYGAFGYCSSLTSVIIGNSITNFGNGTFANCSNLVSLIIRAVTPPILGYNTFYNVPTTVSVYVPCGSVSAYQTAWGYFSNYIEEFANTFFYTASFCEGKVYTDSNFTNLTEAGTYYDTLSNIHGCDSIVSGGSYIFGGKTLTESGIYYDTLQTINGCDSIVELTLTVTGLGIKEIAGQTRNDVQGVEIYDIFGKLLLSQQSLPSLDFLPQGVYILRMQTEKGILTKKIIKK